MPRRMLEEPPGAVEFQPSPFFAEQLLAFELWLEHGSQQKRPPEQLPIVLQASSVASPVCRARPNSQYLLRERARRGRAALWAHCGLRMRRGLCLQPGWTDAPQSVCAGEDAGSS